MTGHFKGCDRRGKRQPDPETPRHVGELGVRPDRRARDFRFQRHAADRAGARPDLPNLRVHRTSVNRSGRRGLRRRRRLRADVALWIGDEFLAALGGTEMIGLTSVLRLVLRGRRVDRHSADEVFDLEVAARGLVAVPATGGMRMDMMAMVRPCFIGGRRCDKTLRIGDEFLAASAAAEVVCRARELRFVLRGHRVDRHPAHRVLRANLFGFDHAH